METASITHNVSAPVDGPNAVSSFIKTFSDVACSHCTESNSLGLGTLRIAPTYLEWVPNPLKDTNMQLAQIIKLNFSDFCLHGVRTENEGDKPALFINIFDKTEEEEEDTPTLSLSSVITTQQSEAKSQQPQPESTAAPETDPNQNALFWFYLPTAAGFLFIISPVLYFFFFCFFEATDASDTISSLLLEIPCPTDDESDADLEAPLSPMITEDYILDHSSTLDLPERDAQHLASLQSGGAAAPPHSETDS